MSGPRDIPSIAPEAGTTINVGKDVIRLSQSNQMDAIALIAGAEVTTDGDLRLESTPGCDEGTVGTYAWSLSPGARILTIEAGSDDCARRQSAIPGTWWKTDCPDQNGINCLGDLEPGTYASQFIDPFVANSESWLPRFGALTYTVPAGWSNSQDYPGGFLLAPQGASRDIEIALLTDPVPHAQGADQCSEKAEPGIGRDAASFGAWLAGLPGFVPTTAEPTTVGGLTGVSVDLEVAASWAATCPYSNGTPVVTTVTGNGVDWNLNAGVKARYILLDLGDGRALLVKIESDTTAAFDANIAETMSVVESFLFTR